MTVVLVAAMALTACQPTPPPPVASPDPVRASVVTGLGAWWDVYDWSPTFIRSRNPSARPPLGLADVDRLADARVQTLFIQTATYRHPAVMLDTWLLRRIIDRARARGMRVVGWYLPQYLDAKFDLDRLLAIGNFGFDGIGVDIESTDNPNVADRTNRLIAQTRFLRGTFPNTPLIAIPVTPVIWEELNRSWWPDFPYRELARYYDAWAPMAYWSYRRNSFIEWFDSYRYTYETVVRLRRLTGRADLAVHPIGGEGAYTDELELFWMNQAMHDSRSIGGSIYDDASTPGALWGSLGQFRREIVK